MAANVSYSIRFNPEDRRLLTRVGEELRLGNGAVLRYLLRAEARRLGLTTLPQAASDAQEDHNEQRAAA